VGSRDDASVLILKYHGAGHHEKNDAGVPGGFKLQQNSGFIWGISTLFSDLPENQKSDREMDLLFGFSMKSSIV
jgi:hypothetical protein